MLFSGAKRRRVPTKAGPLEFGEYGQGEVVLSLHGGGGGWDMGAVIAEHFGGDFRVIAPSRPGYLGTPLAGADTAEKQAQAMVALMDALDIRRAAVFAFSAGGPVGEAIAAHHPERVSALILDSAVSKPYEGAALPQSISHRATLREFLNLVRMPQRLGPTIRGVLSWCANFDEAELAEAVTALQADPERVRYFKRERWAVFPARPRLEGRRNDRQLMATFDIRQLPAIQSRTLICHGRRDGDVDFSHAEHSAGAIPGAELFALDSGFHLSSLSNEWRELHARQIGFLKDIS